MSAYQDVNVLGTRIIHELLGAIWAFSPLLFNIDSLSSMLFKSFYRLNKALITYKFYL